MREIKFRAWDKKLNSMARVISLSFYEEDSQLKGNETESFLYFEKLDTTSLRPFNEIKLMQYTGLEDKNGVDIYEMDIIEDSDKERHVVTFKNGGFGRDGKFLINYNTGEYIVTHEPLINSVIDICEVIGNIYETPELLQEENNELD